MKKGSLAALAAALLLLTGCGAQTPPAQTPPPAETTLPAQTTAPVVEYGGIEIETVCGTIYYPLQWEELLEVETTPGDPMVIAFRALMEGQEPQPLFDLLFGTAVDAPVGLVRTADGQELKVGITVHDFQPDSSWPQNQSDAVYGMQESLNVLLEQLPLEPIAEPDDAEDLRIETSHCTLYYPAKWEKYLLVGTPEEGDTLEFCAVLPGREEKLLFTVRFGGETGHISQTIDGAVTVNIFIAEITFDDDWTAEEKDTVYSMQEDLNHLIEALQGD